MQVCVAHEMSRFILAGISVISSTFPIHVTRTYAHAAKHNIDVKNGSPYSITERRVPQVIPVLGSQPAGDVSHKPDGRLPLLSALSLIHI